jgi:hypothetical protein
MKRRRVLDGGRHDVVDVDADEKVAAGGGMRR